MILFDGRWWGYYSASDGTNNRIGVAISSGASIANFNKAGENPILNIGAAGSWDATHVAHPSVIRVGGELWMYYSGYGSSTKPQIGLAKSSDGITWTKYSGNPIFGPDESIAWESAGVDQPSVIYDGSRFVMAYRGWKTGDQDTHSQIGIATSPDGITWTRLSGNPVLQYGGVGTSDEWGLLSPRLWMEGSTYYLNYAGKPNDANKYSSVHHATATDISVWSKSPNNPVIKPGVYKEVEWAETVRIGEYWFALTPAWFDLGKLVLWTGW